MDTEQILRLIQSIPSKKAEPFKLWLAKVGKERIEENKKSIKVSSFGNNVNNNYIKSKGGFLF